MKRLRILIASVIAISSLTACGSSEQISLNQLPIENINAMTTSDTKIQGREEEHFIVKTSYQKPTVYNDNEMKIEVDFSCPEGGQDVINVSSKLPSVPYQLQIAHHTGKVFNLDTKNKDQVKDVIGFVSEMKINNADDKKVVDILVKDLNGFLNAKKTK